MNEMRSLVFVLAVIATLLLGVSSQCPTYCTCEGTIVECKVIATPSTFPDLPSNTQTLIIIGHSPNDGIFPSLTRVDLQKYENLTELTLSELGISSLASDTFSHLTNLKRIDLSNNDLGTLPVGIFDNLSGMTYLDLRHNRLETISNHELNFPLLSVLSLSDNSIKLNDSTVFKHLRKLEFLDVSHNYIGDPIPDYEGPTDLNAVYMNNCSIANLSVNLRNLVKNAERLQLQDNLITEIPIDFAPNLENLREFHLDNNRIQVLKNLTFQDVYAYAVYLTNNNISTIEPDAFKDFQTGMLRLENNQISNLPARVFEPLGDNLKKLYLNNNPLRVLNDETFYGLTDSTRLRLSAAQIEDISEGAFTNARGKELDLSQNLLTTISNQTVNSFNSFTSVNLTSATNNWNCTEPLLGLRRWLLSNSQSQNCEQVGAENCLLCAFPEKFVGRLLVNLREVELITALDPETTTTEEPTTTTEVPTTTTEEPTTTTEEPTTTTEEPTTPTEEPTTSEESTVVTDQITNSPETVTTPTEAEPTVAATQTSGGGTSANILDANGPNILLYVAIAAGGTVVLLFFVFCCLCMKTCYRCREVTYPLAQKELENGYIPDTGEKQDDSVQLEHVFTIEGHSNPGFKMADDDCADLGVSTTSLSTFRPGRVEPCRDSGIVGDSPGSDQSINRPMQQVWDGRTFGYENRTYSNSDEHT